MAIILQPKFPATVVTIIDTYKVVINRGAKHGIKEGQRFLLYKLDDKEIKDTISGQSLGHLEIPKGTGKVINVQELMSIIESDRWEPSERTVVRRQPQSKLFPEIEEEITTPSNRLKTFDSPEIGDKAKPI
ncbi:Uncharacterised protein [uncultured archaeon]|nr:Uncharacterised protein [uncultured archaeon]